jgi:hypothetical protein
MKNSLIHRMSKTLALVFLMVAGLAGCSDSTSDNPSTDMPSPATDREMMQIGWSSVDITPDAPVYLSGQRYSRISEGVKDPITATALALESDSGEGVVLVSVDLSRIPDEVLGGDMRGRVRELVGEALPGEEVPEVILNATHTHTAPDPQTHTTGFQDRLRPRQAEQWADKLDSVMLPSEYMDFAIPLIAEAVAQAWQSRQPGGISFGLNYAVVGHNRIMSYADGSTIMYGATDHPDFANVEGWVDHSVNLLYTWDENTELTGVVINMASPSQNDEVRFEISADFWHETRLALREQLGDDLYILPQASAAGDQSERPMIHRRAEGRMQELAGEGLRERIADNITDAVTGILPTMQENIEWNPQFDQVTEHVPLTKSDGSVLPVEVYVLRLGEMAFATNPFELYTDFGVRIQERSEAIQTFVVQLAGSGNYVAPQKTIAGGAYGSQREWGPQAGRDLVEGTVALIDGLWIADNEDDGNSIGVLTEFNADCLDPTNELFDPDAYEKNARKLDDTRWRIHPPACEAGGLGLSSEDCTEASDSTELGYICRNVDVTGDPFYNDRPVCMWRALGEVVNNTCVYHTACVPYDQWASIDDLGQTWQEGLDICH